MTLAEFFEKAAPAITALLGALGGTLIGPWVNWAIEGRRQRVDARRALIAGVRRTIMAEEMDMLSFRQTDVYAQLRPFLSPDTRSAMERPSNQITIQIGGGRGEGVNNYRPQLLDELAKLEKKWKLI